MDLGLQLGYWGQLPPPDWVERAVEAERLGFNSVWTAEAWGSDAFSPLAYLAALTERVQLGTSVVQLAARTPTATAMSAITIDHMSGGRFRLGLGVSGPQVVEGWYGRPSNKPLARTREYVEIIRRVVAREEPLVFKPGQFYLLTALVGAVTFICAGVYLAISATQAAFLAMAVTFLFRSVTIAFNWRTAPVSSGAIFKQGDDTAPPFPPKD